MIKQLMPSLLLVLALTLSTPYWIQPLAAQNASASPLTEDTENSDEPEDASPAATIKELQKRIKKISEENRDKIKGALDQLQQKKQAIAGTVQRVSEEAVTIKGAQGTTIITVSDTLSFLKKDKEIELSDIAVDNWVTALGSLIDDALVVEVILVSEQSIKPKNDKIDIGTLTELTGDTIVISSRKDQSDITYSITKTTVFKDPQGEQVDQDLLTEDLTVVVIGYADETESKATTIQSLAPLEE